MARFILIRSSKFPVLEGEESELVNPGTYGKAFALYLQSILVAKGYEIPLVCCEDWGWWVELKLEHMTIGLCCYREHDENTECRFVCSTSPENNRVWSWRKFCTIDLTSELDRLVDDLTTAFQSDDQIELLSLSDEFPF